MVLLLINYHFMDLKKICVNLKRYDNKFVFDILSLSNDFICSRIAVVLTLCIKTMDSSNTNEDTHSTPSTSNKEVNDIREQTTPYAPQNPGNQLILIDLLLYNINIFFLRLNEVTMQPSPEPYSIPMDYQSNTNRCESCFLCCMSSVDISFCMYMCFLCCAECLRCQ